MSDDRLQEWVRSQLPPVEQAGPTRDLWPDVVERSRRRAAVSVVDVSIAALIGVVLLLFPQWFWLLAYHF